MPHVTVYGLAPGLGDDFYSGITSAIVQAVVSIEGLGLESADVSAHFSADLGPYVHRSPVVAVVAGLFDEKDGVARTAEMKQAMCQAIVEAVEVCFNPVDFRAGSVWRPQFVEAINLPFKPAADGFAKIICK